MTDPAVLERALLQRLAIAGEVMGLSATELEEAGCRGPGVLLPLLATRAKEVRADPTTWLLFVAVSGAYPLPEELQRLRRRLDLVAVEDLRPVVLSACRDAAIRNNSLGSTLRVVRDAVVVDVNFSARTRHNTGVQRVVRHTARRWRERESTEFVVWSDRDGSLRSLTPAEESTLFDWHSADSLTGSTTATPPNDEIVVPVDCVMVHIEVPQRAQCGPLRGLAMYSGNRVGFVVHDMIPVVSGDMVDRAESDRFVEFMSVVKHADRLAGVSRSAASEFEGFVGSLSSQGLVGPDVVAVPLPVDAPILHERAGDEVADSELPLIVCVGSEEPRKNHDAVLFAAEALWRTGHRFRLRFIGGGSAHHTGRFDRRIAALRRKGRRFEALRNVDDRVLVESYREAAFTVFPSLHEGFGLPVGESLAFGVPVITSDFGSTAEIAADGGCLLVDPRDDLALMRAMRTLLTDHERLRELRAQAAARPRRDWDDYAEELWAGLVVPITEAGR
ncbi:glycosyltransferase family 4 protein [Agromyces sp. MMS24-K17]|uniref:glycosyltransferase family 4 protein n=1 Tax=Agromyces sp. MMS24-K17 TaxID=3372850 RepID=UPI003754B861